ncbi:MAG: hypothetical protein IJ718_04685 [Paludibacteraceae bacterium]|nr:hypothetical protein [Paludibacteraceae bacterium]
MKTKVLFFVVCSVMFFMAGCSPKSSPENPTQNNSESIIGIWVIVDSINQVSGYYDILDESHCQYVAASYFYVSIGQVSDTIKNYEGDAIYNPNDGCMHTTEIFKWNQDGDFTYLYDKEKQVFKIIDGTFLGFSCKTIISMIGSDEIFDVNRIGVNEAFLLDKTGFIKNQHIYRVNGIKKDL